MDRVVPFVVAFCFTALVVVVLSRIAHKIGLLDHPNQRKKHEGKVPIVGGLAMFLGLVVGLLTINMPLVAYRGLLIALTILVLIGVLDDLHELSPKIRFAGQIIVVLIAVLWHRVLLHGLGNLLFFGPVHLFWLAIPFTVFAIVGIINAFNMIDGVDGLAGTIAIIQFIFLAIFASWNRDINHLLFITVIIGAILGFLCFNFPWKRHKHRVFMGDVGSTVLGLLLAWFMVLLSQGPHRAGTPIAFLWIMAVPLFDITSVVYWRVRHQQSPFHPDRHHLHHLLQNIGCSPLLTVLIMGALSLICGVIGIASQLVGIAEGYMVIAFVVCCLGYSYLLNHSRLFTKQLKREGENGT